MQHYTLLIVSAHQGQRTFLATQLDADGHTIHDADNTAAAIAKLTTHAIDLMILGCMQHPANGPALLRAIRNAEHPRIHPDQPIITLGPDDDLTVLRAYESGSDHHLADSTSYMLLRAILTSVARRAIDEATRRRHVRVGDIDIDMAARAVNVNGKPVRLSRLEFELLAKFASDPVRVLSKHELSRCIWGRNQISGRTVDSHVGRLRRRLSAAGAEGVLANKWGQGWSLTAPQ